MTAQEAIAAMQSLPLRDLNAIAQGRPMLVLSPHPDDESLGCGGLIAEACARGQPPVVAMLTDGAGSHPNSRTHRPPRLAACRAEEARAALCTLGLPPGRLHFLDQPDTRTPTSGPAFDAVARRLAALCADHGCGAMLGPWRHDPHCDHWAAHLIAAQAARLAGAQHWAYPVWGWTLPADTVLQGPAPDGLRLDIARHLPAKRRAIAAHRTQHGALIEDDPAGFTLPQNLLCVFDRPYETFLSDP